MNREKPEDVQIHENGLQTDPNLPTEILPTEAALNPVSGLPMTQEEIRKKQKLEEKTIRSTKPFFQSLISNLLVLSFFWLGTIFSIMGVISIRYVILLIDPLDILLMILIVKKIFKKIDSRLKKKILFKIFSDVPFLDSLSRCLASVLFFCVDWVNGFFYTLVLGPIALVTLIVFFKNICKSCKVNLKLGLCFRGKGSRSGEWCSLL